MGSGILLSLRVAQAIFSVAVLGLTGYVTYWFNNDTLNPTPPQFNFLIFAPIFSFLALAYLELTPRFFARASHPYAHLALEILNSLFYFSGFVALASYLAKILFCRGSVCACARADAVFAAFSWVVWTASAALQSIDLFSGGIKSLKGAKTDEIAVMAMRQEGEKPVTGA